MKTKFLMLALLAVAPRVSAQVQDGAREALERAHHDFLEGKYREMNDALHTALMLANNDAMYVQNAAQLLAKAYEATNDGEMPASIAIPTGVLSVCVGQIYRERYELNAHWRLRMGSDLSKVGLIREVRLSRYPDDVIIDRDAAIGEYKEEVTKGVPSFFATSARMNKPFQDGLYTFTITTTDGQSKDGWFILSDTTVKSTPKVLSPKPFDVFKVGQPVLKWQEYKSELFKPYDDSSESLQVSAVDANDDNWVAKWDFYSDDPSVVTTQVGVDPLGSGDVTLAPGNYVMSLNYREKRHFGPIRLRREAMTMVPFTISK